MRLVSGEKRAEETLRGRSRVKRILERTRRLYDAYTTGFKPGDFRRLFTEGTRGFYRHFGGAQDEAGTQKGFKAFLRNFGRTFWGFMLALAPPRRILYGIAFAIFMTATVVMITAPEGAAIREDVSILSIYSFIIVSFLLALELADKLSAKDEIEIAREVQLSLLPPPGAQVRGFDLASFSAPAREVGGDYFDLADRGDRVCIAIGDVSGTGLAAGLVMAMAKSAFQAQLMNDTSPGAVLSTLNRIVMDAGDPRTLMTFLYLAVEPASGRMSCANAGHIYPLWYSVSDGRLSWLEGSSLPLGVKSDLPVVSLDRRLAPGDIVVLTSDGAVETMNEEGDSFGYSRLEESVRRRLGLEPKEILSGILEDIQGFAAAGPGEDDTTLIVARFVGAAAT